MTEVKAYLYTRLSQKSDTSIEAQIELGKKYCRENELELAKIFNDGEKSRAWKLLDLVFGYSEPDYPENIKWHSI